MAIDEIDQAALASRWGDAEADLVDAICGVLDEPRPTVIRVLHAAAVLRDRRYLDLDHDVKNALEPELRTALQGAVERGLRRVLVRRAIAGGDTVRVSLKAIVGESLVRMCAGCPVSMRCMARSISTPDKCIRRGIPIRVNSVNEREIMYDLEPGALARPVRLRGDALRVECAHPRGTWDVDIMDVVA